MVRSPNDTLISEKLELLIQLILKNLARSLENEVLPTPIGPLIKITACLKSDKILNILLLGLLFFIINLKNH